MNDDDQYKKAQLNTINRLGIKSHRAITLSSELGIVSRGTKKRGSTSKGKRKANKTQ